MIVVVDYGMGNLGSVLNMLKRVGAPARVSSDPCEIQRASKLILPGVGAFDNGMANLAERNLVGVLNKQVLEHQVPILGICLGVQLFTRRSEEGKLPGFGWIDAETVRFEFGPHGQNLKVPHMGWNVVRPVANADLFFDLPLPPRFYFVHSYHLRCRNDGDVLAWCDYGHPFAAAIRHRNITGTQFHPEKSHQYGLKLLANFAAVSA